LPGNLNALAFDDFFSCETQLMSSFLHTDAQTFKIILTQYFMNEQLGAEDYTKMLAKAEEVYA